MNAGPLCHRVTVQAKTITTDAYGGPVETWTDVATVWASVEPLQGRELANAQATNAEITTRIRMRYLAGVSASNRIVFEGRYFNLTPPIDVEMKHIELVIMASEGLDEG